MQVEVQKDRRHMHSNRGSVIKPWPFNHTHSMTGKEFKTYKTPCVYVWKRGDEWLYVGCSYRGLQRVVDSKHHALHQADMHDTDEILIMHNLKSHMAHAIEIDMIRRYRPKYNKITP